MLSFSDFIKLKSKDIFGTDIRKTEFAGIRAIVECIKENDRFIVSVDKKKLIQDFLDRLMEKKPSGNINRDKKSKE